MIDLKINKKYDIIYADPPWDYKGQTQHNGKGGKETGGALSHYPTLKLKELKKINVHTICKEDCLLYIPSRAESSSESVAGESNSDLS